MTDDNNLTPGGQSNDQQVTISVVPDEEGHWVQWHKGETSGILGPYVDPDMAEQVKVAKERELLENEGSINDASPFRAP
jgi:hypothetical protein